MIYPQLVQIEYFKKLLAMIQLEIDLHHESIHTYKMDTNFMKLFFLCIYSILSYFTYIKVYKILVTNR